MRPVTEINEIRQDRHRHPGDGLIRFYITDQFIYIGVPDGNLLVAAPTLRLCRKAGAGSSLGARMTVEALDPQADMHHMWKLNWLRWRDLGKVNPDDDGDDQDQKAGANANSHGRLFP